MIRGNKEAKDWVIYNKKETKWAVLCATIQTDAAFDIIGNLQHWNMFIEAKDELIKKHREAGKDPVYFKDRMVFIEFEKIGKYNVIRALVDAVKKEYISYMIGRPQVQICVKDANTIKNVRLHSQGGQHVK